MIHIDYNRESVLAQYEQFKGQRGPYNDGTFGPALSRDGYFLVDKDGTRVLDYHSQILCNVLGGRNTMAEVSAMTDRLGLNTVGSDFTHPLIDELRERLMRGLREDMGAEYEVKFASSGTAANTEALRVSQAAMEGRMHVMGLDEGYHGNGAVLFALRHPAWHQGGFEGKRDLPSSLPASFASFVEGENGRNFADSFMEHVEHSLHRAQHPHLIAEGGVQGVAGFRKIDLEALQRMAVVAHLSDGHVHYDGVQTQPWRTGTGRFFPEGLVDKSDPRTVPDFVTSAKGSGDGEPLAWLAIRREVMEEARAAGLGKGYDTYAQTLRGAAAGILVDEAVSDPAFQENIRARGEQTERGFAEFIERFPSMVVGQDGMGLMRSLVLRTPADVNSFRKIGAKGPEKLRMFVGAGGLKGDVLRFGGRLDATEEITDEMLRRTRGIFEEIDVG